MTMWPTLQPKIWEEDRRRRTEDKGVLKLLSPKITESESYLEFIQGNKPILKELMEAAQKAKSLDKRAR